MHYTLRIPFICYRMHMLWIYDAFHRTVLQYCIIVASMRRWCLEKQRVYLFDFLLTSEFKTGALFKAHNGHALICKNCWITGVIQSLFIIKMHLCSHLRWVRSAVNRWADRVCYFQRFVCWIKITLRTLHLKIYYKSFMTFIKCWFAWFSYILYILKYISLKVIKNGQLSV